MPLQVASIRRLAVGITDREWESRCPGKCPPNTLLKGFGKFACRYSTLAAACELLVKSDLHGQVRYWGLRDEGLAVSKIVQIRGGV
jgi:hypothetical protein